MVVFANTNPYLDPLLFGYGVSPLQARAVLNSTVPTITRPLAPTVVSPSVLNPLLASSVLSAPLVDEVVFSNTTDIQPTQGIQLASAFNTLLSQLNWQQMKVALAYLQDETLNRKGDNRITSKVGFWNEAALGDETRTQLKAMADTIQAMSPQNKIDFVTTLVGPDSPLPDYLNKVLILGQRPTAWDQLSLLYPYTYHYSDGVGVYSATAFGLSLLPLVVPASVITNPWLPTQWLSAMALTML